ncbi:biogenesis of lysosome-related organelles complex 1 subunit 4 [Leptinotarsa decemlineata]|uniref:biogenesis of lysosome-related organelles complex 1 subunit 4 n=1 Tax=Leptinotarsa decemlineata TaxID=7539 RepID=UPI000C2520EA|nr:biogenesis of lysosome-related organelles complex 1 subunit 4 [Leptinotarsa decemlineata]
MAEEKTAKDFSKYLEVDLDHKLKPITASIDDMLTRLEEFQTMISFVVQDRIDYNDILTAIPNYKNEFDNMCKKIDTLEKLMAHIKSNLDQLECGIEKAEDELGCSETTMKVTNIFTPLFRKQSGKKEFRFQSDNFKTENYFH